jgi:hypothetical protein
MSTPGHLDNHHRNTLRQLLEHPVSHNVEWRAVLSLLGAIGSVEQRHDGRVSVKVGEEHAVFETKGQKDLDTETMARLRRLLSTAGYTA